MYASCVEHLWMQVSDEQILFQAIGGEFGHHFSPGIEQDAASCMMGLVGMALRITVEHSGPACLVHHHDVACVFAGARWHQLAEEGVRVACRSLFGVRIVGPHAHSRRMWHEQEFGALQREHAGNFRRPVVITDADPCPAEVEIEAAHFAARKKMEHLIAGKMNLALRSEVAVWSHQNLRVEDSLTIPFRQARTDVEVVSGSQAQDLLCRRTAGQRLGVGGCIGIAVSADNEFREEQEIRAGGRGLFRPECDGGQVFGNASE